VQDVPFKTQPTLTKTEYADLQVTSPCHSSGAYSPASHRGGGRGSIQSKGHVGFVVDKVALKQVFSEYFGFPCQFSFHQMLNTHLLSGAGTIGQLVADVPSGLSLTPPHEMKKNTGDINIFLIRYSSFLFRSWFGWFISVAPIWSIGHP
jgi:hypothetical protein